VALPERKAHEVRHPAHGLLIEQVRGAGGGRQVGVVGRGKGGGEHAGFQAAGTDVGEVQRPRGGDAGVEDADGIAERGLRVTGLLGQAGLQALDQLRVGGRLGRPRAVERRPRRGQVPGQITKDAVPVGQRRASRGRGARAEAVT